MSTKLFFFYNKGGVSKRVSFICTYITENSLSTASGANEK